MKNPKILKFIPVILKLKRCVSMQLKIFPYLLRYVPDQYKTQQMCDKVNLEKQWNIKVCYKNQDCYKYQEICNKAVDNYLHVLEFVSECFKSQKTCDKAVDTYPSIFLNAIILKK